MDAIAYGVSIFLGVVAGALVQFGLGFLERRSVAAGLRKSAVAELRYIETIKAPHWKDVLGKLRKHKVENRMQDYVAFLDLARVPTASLYKLITSGQAYTKLSSASITELLELLDGVSRESQAAWQTKVNEIASGTDLPRALRDLDFVESRIEDFRQMAAHIAQKLDA